MPSMKWSQQSWICGKYTTMREKNWRDHNSACIDSRKLRAKKAPSCNATSQTKSYFTPQCFSWMDWILYSIPDNNSSGMYKRKVGGYSFERTEFCTGLGLARRILWTHNLLKSDSIYNFEQELGAILYVLLTSLLKESLRVTQDHNTGFAKRVIVIRTTRIGLV